MEFFANLFTGQVFALLGAALAMGFAGAGSAKGTGIAGEAGAGVLSVAPEHFIKVLVLQALPGSQGIYGMIIAFQIIGVPQVADGTIPFFYGVGLLCAALPMAIGGYYSAIAQGRVSAAGMGIVASNPNHFIKGVTLAGVVETYAILSLVISIMMIGSITALLG